MPDEYSVCTASMYSARSLAVRKFQLLRSLAVGQVSAQYFAADGTAGAGARAMGVPVSGLVVGVPVGTDAGWVGGPGGVGGGGGVFGGVGARPRGRGSGAGVGGHVLEDPTPSPRLSSRSTTSSLFTGRAMAQSATENKQVQKRFIFMSQGIASILLQAERKDLAFCDKELPTLMIGKKREKLTMGI